MNNLLPRLEAVSAFNQLRTERACAYAYQGRDIFFEATKCECDRRAKLDQAMRHLVKCVDDMCARYDDAVIRNKDASPLIKGMTLDVRHVFQKAIDNLEAVVASMEAEK